MASDFAARNRAPAAHHVRPTSLKLAFRLLREGKALSLNGTVSKWNTASPSRAVMGADFREGVRAVLLDKDGAPRWHPAALAGVKDADIAGHFAPLGARELQFAENTGE